MNTVRYYRATSGFVRVLGGESEYVRILAENSKLDYVVVKTMHMPIEDPDEARLFYDSYLESIKNKLPEDFEYFAKKWGGATFVWSYERSLGGLVCPSQRLTTEWKVWSDKGFEFAPIMEFSSGTANICLATNPHDPPNWRIVSVDTETVPEEIFASDAFVTDASFLDFIERLERSEGANISPYVWESTLPPEALPTRLTQEEALALVEEWKRK